METALHRFLNSTLLYKYLVDETDTVESAEVAYFIAKYPEAKAAFHTLEAHLKIRAQVDAIEAPKAIIDNVINTIEASNGPKIIHITQKNKTPWYSIAASTVAVIFALTSFLLLQKNQNLFNENNIVVDEIFDLRSDIQNNNSKLDALSEQFMKLNDPDAKKYVLTGNERAKNLKTVAYINPVEKTSMIDVIALPKLPEAQYYRMWAELQGRMVNLGILDETKGSQLKQIPYMENASALRITIETRGAIASNTANEVAEIIL